LRVYITDSRATTLTVMIKYIDALAGYRTEQFEHITWLFESALCL